jgi:hypothetical protein
MTISVTRRDNIAYAGLSLSKKERLAMLRLKYREIAVLSTVKH